MFFRRCTYRKYIQTFDFNNILHRHFRSGKHIIKPNFPPSSFLVVNVFFSEIVNEKIIQLSVIDMINQPKNWVSADSVM